jgi:murein DD-endopeptidase MepM/ murein hydrolase activator NlpD
LRPKKTLSDRLTTRYQLVIRNEENLAEKTTVGFTYAKLLVVSVAVFVVLFGFSLFLSKTLLAKWFDPKHAQMEQDRKLFELALRVDSLAGEVQRKELYIQNVQRILSGDTSSQFQDPASVLVNDRGVRQIGSLKVGANDSLFRQEFERSGGAAMVNFTSGKFRELQEMVFFPPLVGLVSDKYDVKKGHYGVDIVAKTNEPVKSIADGTVIMASWTQDSGHVIAVQHRGNLISVYKHNAELLKKVGSFVNAGDILAIVGNSGEMTNGPHLHFELWYNGSSLNPEEFVTF